jgi:hypothetical protein
MFVILQAAIVLQYRSGLRRAPFNDREKRNQSDDNDQSADVIQRRDYRQVNCGNDRAKGDETDVGLHSDLLNRASAAIIKTYAKAFIACGSMVLSFFCRLFFAPGRKIIYTREIRNVRKSYLYDR